ncbi:acryloyl-CoA reductase [Cytophagaceae bacterium 50C-KIRBA]|uniref:Acryloyl-CoA reductase n=1 Tax=Aquirufa beregesia TaxID=2516556 RepID=A0ABX0F239_9BACT|nr:YhdH/YhfP family quinone oxidoreductase [Aquirufa beregesia]NGZ43920.1 acryloyl-CoA reductase [Aquirufa beregesia]
MDFFNALWTSEMPDGHFETSLQAIPFHTLRSDRVLIQVSYSSLNYKDALSANGHKGITRDFPHIPGIDAVGKVIQDPSQTYAPGQEVIVTGFDLGMNTHGGLAEYIAVPANWIIPLPHGMSALKAMQWGTAGLTAGMALAALWHHGVRPNQGEIGVTGATGGLGLISILLLKHLGFQVAAITGKMDQYEFLKQMGVDRIIDREEFLSEKPRALYPMQFAGAIDVVGGEVLSKIIKSLHFGGAVSACGMASSVELPMQIYPFILRGANLLGIYSADSPLEKKQEIWDKLANDWNIPLEAISRTITLKEAPAFLTKIREGNHIGRTVVRIKP